MFEIIVHFDVGGALLVIYVLLQDGICIHRKLVCVGNFVTYFSYAFSSLIELQMRTRRQSLVRQKLKYVNKVHNSKLLLHELSL
jgi:hypothetical protein